MTSPAGGSQPIEIWNLPVSTSKQYALNKQEELKNLPHLLEDSENISSKTEVYIVSPAKPTSEYEAKYTLGHITSWAVFPKLRAFSIAAGRLFVREPVPSIGDLEQQSTRLENFSAKVPTEPLSQKEHKTLEKLLTCVKNITTTFEEIQKRLKEYHRA